MKKFLLLAFLLSFNFFIFSQGISYKGSIKFENADLTNSDAKEFNSNYIEFEAFAQGGKYKMVYLNDFGFFKKGSYILGDTTTKLAYFVFPETKTYWELNIDELSKIGKSMQKFVKMKYSNESVSVSTLPSKVISGYPCSGKRIKLSYDVESSVLGMKNKTHQEEITDFYTTTKFDVFSIFGGYNWHSQGLVTLDEAFNQQINQKVGFLGFPIQIVTESYSNGKFEGKSTLTTKEISLIPIPSTNFILPSGYKKEDAGFLSIIKNIGGENQSVESKDGVTEQESETKKDGEKKEDKSEEDKTLQKAGKKILKKVIKKIIK